MRSLHQRTSELKGICLQEKFFGLSMVCQTSVDALHLCVSQTNPGLRQGMKIDG